MKTLLITISFILIAGATFLFNEYYQSSEGLSSGKFSLVLKSNAPVSEITDLVHNMRTLPKVVSAMYITPEEQQRNSGTTSADTLEAFQPLINGNATDVHLKNLTASIFSLDTMKIIDEIKYNMNGKQTMETRQ